MSDDQKQIFLATFTSKLYVRQAKERKQPGRFLWGNASLEFLLQFKYCMRKAVLERSKILKCLVNRLVNKKNVYYF